MGRSRTGTLMSMRSEFSCPFDFKKVCEEQRSRKSEESSWMANNGMEGNNVSATTNSTSKPAPCKGSTKPPTSSPMCLIVSPARSR